MPRTPTQRTAFSLFTALGIGALTLAGLTGCAAPSHPSTAITNHPVVRPTSPSVAHPAAPTAPGGATCDELAPVARVQAALESTAVTFQPYYEIEGGGPPELYDMVVPLAGGLQCLWQNSTTDPTVSLNVAVLPNASAAWTAASSDLEASDDGHMEAAEPHVPVYGDVSWTQCDNVGDPWYGECNINIKVGNYWVAVDEINPSWTTPYPPTSADVTLLNGIVSAVRGLPARPATWHPTPETFTLPTSCDAVVPLAALRTATGEPALAAVADSDPGAEQGTLNGAAGRAANQLQCFWSSDDETSVAFNLVPGSAAVWSSEGGPAGATVSGMTSLSGLGSQAYQQNTTNGPYSSAEVIVLVGHSWFDLSEEKSAPIDSTSFDSLASQVIAAMGYHS